VTSLTVTPDEKLKGTIDFETVARGIPKSHLVKGVFFARLVSSLGPAFEQLIPSLDGAPRLGRYVPFSDYPQSDYVRVSAAAAHKLHPTLPLREALRRLGRDDLAVFASTTFGKVLLSAVGDARTVLMKTPYIYEKMAPGDFVMTVEDIDRSHVRLEIAPMYGIWEYQLGQMEGVVLNFRQPPLTTVVELPGRKVRFDVRHIA
jgi:uncharacterized protein (TIGR02265 family)